MQVLENIPAVPEPQRFIAVLWLSFLVAGVATAVLFALVDPVAMAECAALPDLSRVGYYSAGFLGLWLVSAASALISTYFLYPGRDPGARAGGTAQGRS